MELYGIFGAGGFGREVMPIAEEMFKSGYIKGELVFVVENLQDEKMVSNDIKVMSDIEFVYGNADAKYFNVAISNSSTRQRISERMLGAGLIPFSISSTKGISLSKNSIGMGSILCPFTTLTSNITIGKFFHMNIYSYVGHDCIIGDYVTFAPKVCCNGNIVIKDYAYIGTGAIIKHGQPGNPIVIGKGAVVGMGAVVTKSVPDGVTVVGNPARELKKGGV